MLSYVTIEDEEGGKQRLNQKKRAFDEVNAERIAFEASGGGSSSTEPLESDKDVNFIMSDQYVGINDVVYDEQECLLFNWASTSKKKRMLGMLL